MTTQNEGFDERINGRLEAGAPVHVTIEGKRFEARYVRPMLARKHRCVVMSNPTPRQKRYHTVSTRKVLPI